MPTPQEYFQEIERIVGDDLSDGEVNLRLTWNNYAEGKAHIDRIRDMQRRLRVLKKGAGAEVSGMKSDFMIQKASVGASLGAGLAGFYLGRRTVGKFNAATRDDLRRKQVQSVAPYENVKRSIDQITYRMDGKSFQFLASNQNEERFRTVIAQFPRFPFAYYGLGLGLKAKRDPEWRTQMLRAKEILQRTTSIIGHNGDHSTVLKFVEDELNAGASQ